MSPWRTLQWRSPARSSRARASASMSSDRSMPRPRSMRGPNSSSMRPVPVPRSSSERNGPSASAPRIAVLDRRVGDMQRADAVPLGGVAAEIGLRGGGALRPAPRRAARGRAPASGRRDRAARSVARQVGGAAALAQAEERPRAFAEALDQPGLGEELQMPRDARLRLAQDVGEVRDGELGLARSARMRRRVSSPAALSAPLRILEPQVGSGGHGVGSILNFSGAHDFRRAYKDIFIRLSGECKTAMGRLRGGH